MNKTIPTKQINNGRDLRYLPERIFELEFASKGLISIEQTFTTIEKKKREDMLQ